MESQKMEGDTEEAALISIFLKVIFLHENQLFCKRRGRSLSALRCVY